MLAVNNLTSAPEHTRSMAALPLGESPLLKVLLTHIKGRCFQSWLIVPPVEMPVPSHVPHSLPFRTPRSKGASGGSLSLSLGLSLPMWMLQSCQHPLLDTRPSPAVWVHTLRIGLPVGCCFWDGSVPSACLSLIPLCSNNCYTFFKVLMSSRNRNFADPHEFRINLSKSCWDFH